MKGKLCVVEMLSGSPLITILGEKNNNAEHTHTHRHNVCKRRISHNDVIHRFVNCGFVASSLLKLLHLVDFIQYSWKLGTPLKTR